MSAELALHEWDPERTVLGALLVDPKPLQTVEAILRVEHFTDPRHRVIFAALLTMGQASRSVDLLTLKSELSAAGNLDSSGGIQYLAGLVDGLPRLSNVDAWARIVRESARRRYAVRIAHALIAEAEDEGQETDDLVDRAHVALGRLMEAGDKRIVKLRDVLPRALSDLEQFTAAKEGVTGVPTGLLDLDRCLSGLQPGRLYIVAARTSRGKSVLCAQIAVNAAMKGHRGLVFSMEMEPYQLAQRMLLADAEVDRYNLRNESPKAEYSWAKVTQAYGRLADLPVWFDQRESPNLAQVRASSRQQHGENGIGLIVVDYLQRMTLDPTVVKAGGLWAGVGDIAKGLKTLALALRVPIVAACQLTSDAEEKRPTLAMLAQAQSVISAEADAVVLLHPVDLTNWKAQRFPEVHFLVDKNRTGPCQDIRVSFEKECSRFVSLARETEWKA